MKVQTAAPISSAPRTMPWRELATGAAVTLALHLTMVLALVWGAADDAEDDAPQLALVVEAELLRWGEVEPEDTALPTIANPRPAPVTAPPPARDAPQPPETQEAPTEVVNLNAANSAAATPPTELRPEERDRRDDTPTAHYRGETNPHRPVNDEAIQGFADGFRGGTSLSPSAQRNLLARIQEQLQRAFSPPRSLSDEELRRLQIRLHVRIASDGRIVGWDILQASGNRQFDTAATMTLNRFRSGSDRLDLASISDPGFRELIEAQGLPIMMVGH